MGKTIVSTQIENTYVDGLDALARMFNISRAHATRLCIQYALTEVSDDLTIFEYIKDELKPRQVRRLITEEQSCEEDTVMDDAGQPSEKSADAGAVG